MIGMVKNTYQVRVRSEDSSDTGRLCSAEYHDEYAQARAAAKSIWDDFTAKERLSYSIEIVSYYQEGSFDVAFCTVSVHRASERDVADYTTGCLVDSIEKLVNTLGTGSHDVVKYGGNSVHRTDND